MFVSRNVFWAANQHIQIISEGSFDSKDWSFDAENSALHHKNKLHFKIYSKRKQFFFQIVIFSQYYCFYCIFNQTNATLVSIRNFFKKK